MESRRTHIFRTVLDVLHYSGGARLGKSFTAGAGLVFTLHHVRPWTERGFAPNRLLEVTPEFLDAALTRIRAAGYDLVTLDEAWARLVSGNARPFAALTFDDGYRDVRDYALPVLRRHGAPMTMFVATSFADGTGDLWWLSLEEAIRRLERVELCGLSVDTRTDAGKNAAWDALYWRLRAIDEGGMREAIAGLAEKAGVGGHAEALCMGWPELEEFARDPLVTIGAHTVSHLMLAKWPREVARAEIEDSGRILTERLGTAPRHLAYPVGDPTSAGVREFALARDAGFTTAWTTRPGHLFAGHRNHPHSLPRVSLNGLFQKSRYVDVFLSGTPFALWNRGRRLNIA